VEGEGGGGEFRAPELGHGCDEGMKGVEQGTKIVRGCANRSFVGRIGVRPNTAQLTANE